MSKLAGESIINLGSSPTRTEFSSNRGTDLQYWSLFEVDDVVARIVATLSTYPPQCCCSEAVTHERPLANPRHRRYRTACPEADAGSFG
jgi:hypothetical protein